MALSLVSVGHLCILPKCFGKKDLWIANLIIVYRITSWCLVVVTLWRQTPVVSMTTRLIYHFIGLSFKKLYLMTGLNLMHASFMKSIVNQRKSWESADFNEIHSHRSDLNRETSNKETKYQLHRKIAPYISGGCCSSITMKAGIWRS